MPGCYLIYLPPASAGLLPTPVIWLGFIMGWQICRADFLQVESLAFEFALSDDPPALWNGGSQQVPVLRDESSYRAHLYSPFSDPRQGGPLIAAPCVTWRGEQAASSASWILRSCLCNLYRGTSSGSGSLDWHEFFRWYCLVLGCFPGERICASQDSFVYSRSFAGKTVTWRRSTFHGMCMLGTLLNVNQAPI